VSSIFVAYYIGVVVDCDERIERHLLERLFESRTESKPFEQQKERLLEEISVRRFCCYFQRSIPIFCYSHALSRAGTLLMKIWKSKNETRTKKAPRAHVQHMHKKEQNKTESRKSDILDNIQKLLFLKSSFMRISWKS
jgi:hypothetical protein